MTTLQSFDLVVLTVDGGGGTGEHGSRGSVSVALAGTVQRAYLPHGSDRPPWSGPSRHANCACSAFGKISTNDHEQIRHIPRCRTFSLVTGHGEIDRDRSVSLWPDRDCMRCASNALGPIAEPPSSMQLLCSEQTIDSLSCPLSLTVDPPQGFEVDDACKSVEVRASAQTHHWSHCTSISNRTSSTLCLCSLFFWIHSTQYKGQIKLPRRS